MSVSLFFFFTTEVNALRFEAGDLFLLQTEFEKYRSMYMGLGYLLAFSANIATHLCSCKTRVSENFAGFFKIVNMCFFTVYSYEERYLLPCQVEFFSYFPFAHWNVGAGLLQCAGQLALVGLVYFFFSFQCVCVISVREGIFKALLLGKTII